MVQAETERGMTKTEKGNDRDRNVEMKNRLSSCLWYKQRQKCGNGEPHEFLSLVQAETEMRNEEPPEFLSLVVQAETEKGNEEPPEFRSLVQAETEMRNDRDRKGE